MAGDGSFLEDVHGLDVEVWAGQNAASPPNAPNAATFSDFPDGRLQAKFSRFFETVALIAFFDRTTLRAAD